MAYTYHIGIDENGLGAQLGPLVTTAVMASTTELGSKAALKRLPKSISKDLDDSKRLVAHGNVALGEAWARVVSPQTLNTPDELLSHLTLESRDALTEPCPKHVRNQCWNIEGEQFEADEGLLKRVATQRNRIAKRGIVVERVMCSVVCTRLLNDAKLAGANRFVRNLHSMERLALRLRQQAGQDVHAVCGKVGGMTSYSKFFGPLSGHLHAILGEERKSSGYRFPGLGELHFARDADAQYPLVMLASLVGKYVRELLMARISRFYGAAADGDVPIASGYNDPVSKRFVAATELTRSTRRVPSTCFVRSRED